MIDNHRGWHELLPYAMLGYQTNVRTSIGVIPYPLVYGIEAFIPAEVEIPSLRIIQEADLSNAEWVGKRIDQLTLIDENRMVAICYGQLYRQRMIRSFHKRVRAIIFDIVQRCFGPVRDGWNRMTETDQLRRCQEILRVKLQFDLNS
ncbi:uncharacterized protein [Solanum lycopersicum]|uniref:uncharacterized protein n=1 Tax=Solanum lycopersicum TaxID=4081 RepID=UPI00374998DC